MKLFPEQKVVGVFKGFSEGGLEFHADIILKYQNIFQNVPMHGQFLIVGLEGDDEAVLGRITSISSEGRLSSTAGEDYALRAVAENRPVSEDLREQYLKYKVNIRVLGVIRLKNDGSKESIIFVPSHRRLPHVGSKVAFLSDELLREVTGSNIDAAEFGYFTLGEFIYSGNDKRLQTEPWMRICNPKVITKFQVDQLVSRRSFVFARAGFGKSNLVKLLFSNLYKSTPTIKKRTENVPVGTIIFDPDGEYFWPDDSGRPGLCDVEGFEEKVVVFTNKQGPSKYYESFVAGNIRLDIRRLRAGEVISISLPEERQNQQNVIKLKGLNANDWAQLVNLIHQDGNGADTAIIKSILRLKDDQEFEALAAKANMTYIVKLLHDPTSQLKDKLFKSLKAGKLCIVDISQMRGKAGLILSGIILQQIFEHNQTEFTKSNPDSIPTIAVLEEAQSVLGGSGGAESPYVAWVKEGRKYGLGAVLITQQPGSISDEILSQGDNWFIFHLLSAGDLQAVRKANAHFSNDLLSSLLNEPIPGNGVFWSSSAGKPYPIPVRVLSFENATPLKDSKYNLGPTKTFASDLSEEFHTEMLRVTEIAKDTSEFVEEDTLRTQIVAAIQSVKNDTVLIEKIKKSIPWKGLIEEFKKKFSSSIEEDSNQLAHENIPALLNNVFGENNWSTEQKPSKTDPTRSTRWIIIHPTGASL